MLVIYDLQKDLTHIDSGEFSNAGPVLAREKYSTRAKVELIEDIKTICVYNRDVVQTGIDIKLSEIPGIMPGDRITVTGRVCPKEPIGNKHWAVALIIVEAFPEGQLTQHPAPESVFSVSHILEKEQLDLTMAVHTVIWGTFQPLMDMYIDSVLITRRDMSSEGETDTRRIIYEFDGEPDSKVMGSDQAASLGRNAPYVYCSGYPDVRVFRRGDTTALHVGNRFNDWDGLDINIARMELRPGSQYQITIKGRIDGDAPAGSSIMVQGIPGYAWRSNTAVFDNEEFTLTYIMSRTEVERWGTIRITTNTTGASVSFYVYGIEVLRL